MEKGTFLMGMKGNKVAALAHGSDEVAAKEATERLEGMGCKVIIVDEFAFHVALAGAAETSNLKVEKHRRVRINVEEVLEKLTDEIEHAKMIVPNHRRLRVKIHPAIWEALANHCASLVAGCRPEDITGICGIDVDKDSSVLGWQVGVTQI